MEIEKTTASGARHARGLAFSANNTRSLEDPGVVRHHVDQIDQLVNALRTHADIRGCSPRDLLAARLVEMQRRIIVALGEVSLEQFRNPGPEGFIMIRFPERGFDFLVEFRPVFVATGIYHERLVSPGLLQQRKAQLLGKFLEHAPSLSRESAEKQVIDQLRTGEDHWDGSKKADLALEILSTEGTAIKALSFVENDQKLDLRTFAQIPAKLQQLAQEILNRSSRGDPPSP